VLAQLTRRLICRANVLVFELQCKNITIEPKLPVPSQMETYGKINEICGRRRDLQFNRAQHKKNPLIFRSGILSGPPSFYRRMNRLGTRVEHLRDTQ